MDGAPKQLLFSGFYSPPFMMYDEGGILCGPLIDLAKYLSEALGFRAAFCELSQGQLNTFNESKIDLGLGVFRTAARAKLTDFSLPLFRFGLQGLGLADYSALAMEDLDSTGVKFGVKEGDIGHDYLLERYGTEWIDRHCRVLDGHSSDLSRSLLERHECDVVLCDLLTLMHWKDDLPSHTWLTFLRPIYAIDMCIAINRQSRVQVASVNAWLRTNYRNHKYQEFVAAVIREGETLFEPVSIPEEAS